MIVLDTNVLSEPMRPGADPRVAAWLDRQAIDALYLTTISLAALLAGVALLPLGKRRAGLEARLGAVVGLFEARRLLSFDAPAARLFALLTARASAAGLAISFADGQIAAIAAARGFTVASRDTAPFIAAGLPVINPWEES
jgi:predicted nucleic acid-binding protein